MNNKNHNITTQIIITTNKNRREDLKRLARIRLEKGVRYSNLKLIFSLFCMHCSDLKREEAEKEINEFAKKYGIKGKDLSSQFKYTYKPGREVFEVYGQNRYKYSNPKLISILRIIPEEAKELNSICPHKIEEDEFIQKSFDNIDEKVEESKQEFEPKEEENTDDIETDTNIEKNNENCNEEIYYVDDYGSEDEEEFPW